MAQSFRYCGSPRGWSVWRRWEMALRPPTPRYLHARYRNTAVILNVDQDGASLQVEERHQPRDDTLDREAVPLSSKGRALTLVDEPPNLCLLIPFLRSPYARPRLQVVVASESALTPLPSR